MKVEVVYATADGATAEELELAEGTTLGEALKASTFAATPAAAYAVFGKVVPTERILEDGDRIELLRELVADPKDARRQRASSMMGE